MPSPRLFLLPLLLILALPRPAEAQTEAEQIDALLTQYHEVGQFNGAVLAAEGDDVLYEKGFGDANMEWDIPNAPDTRFRIGSVTKQFTAALILQLMEEGKIDLQGHVTDYLSDYPAASGDRITIHQLLNHTSGLPNYTSLPGFMRDDARDPYAPDSFLAVFSGLDLDFEPGTEWNYSNSGYFLLGAIIEHVTGKPYDEVLRERILAPLGLDDTGYDHTDAIIEHRAEGYERAGRSYRHAAYLDSSIPYAAGMMYSTVGDLLRWTRALHGGGVFERPETLEMMTTPGMEGYGYGIGIGNIPVGDAKVRMIRHSGGINGFNSQLWYMPNEAYTIAVLDNGGGNSGAVADAVARVLYDQPTTAPVVSIAEPLTETVETDGVDAAVARYRELKANEPDAYDFGESELNGLGYYYLGRGEIDTAIRIFQLNVEMFPEAFNPYDSLGEAYLEAGNRELSIVNYKKALELNPGAQTAKDALRRLGVEDVAIDPDVINDYVGSYEAQPTFVFTVTTEDERLFVQATGQPRFEIFPSAEDEFYLTVVDAQISFNRDASGEVESLTLRQNGQHMPAPKVE